jgi:hypothetical protein
MNAPVFEPGPGQNLLFDSLPESVRADRPGRRPRRAAAATVRADTGISEALPGPPPGMLAAAPALSPATFQAAPVMPARPLPPAPAPFNPAALTNPELKALVLALPDHRLGVLVVEAARELKRRLTRGGGDEWDDDGENGRPAEPDPALLRAARQAAGELTGED